tara:strand:+ start:88 stop:432 length:345 start_codon:yes stop_codon:yes gene_type:complete
MSNNKEKKISCVIDELYATIKDKKTADPTTSYTAQLYTKGRGFIARKIIEEAAEIMLAATTENVDRLTEESADILYHLTVLWAETGVAPCDVWHELNSRKGLSGIAERQSRPLI